MGAVLALWVEEGTIVARLSVDSSKPWLALEGEHKFKS